MNIASSYCVKMQENSSDGNSQVSFSNNLKALISDLNASFQEGDFSSALRIETLSHERTLPNVLTRIKFIVDQRKEAFQLYRDADFKQFWLPDQLSKSCYDCCERFTPLRRRHHCRVCGQIFCSKCCNKLIPGKVIGYKGDLRVCMYCYKVVLTYLQSSNCIEEDVLEDLRTLQKDFDPLRTSKTGEIDNNSMISADLEKLNVKSHHKRRPMFGFMEENYSASRPTRSKSVDSNCSADSNYLERLSSERQLLLKDSQQLQALWSGMLFGPNRLPLATNRHRLKVFPETFVGKELVLWLITNEKASCRQSAVAIGQALLDSGFIFCVSQADQIFNDEHILYSILRSSEIDRRSNYYSSVTSFEGGGHGGDDGRNGSSSYGQEELAPPDSQEEPLWLKQIVSQLECNSQFTPCYSKSYCESNDCGDTVNVSSSCCVDVDSRSNYVTMKKVSQPISGEVDQGRLSLYNSSPVVSSKRIFQTTVTSALTESLLSSSYVDGHQPGIAPVIEEEVLEALKTLEPKVAEATAAHWQIRKEAQVKELEGGEGGGGGDEESGTRLQIDEQTRLSLEVQREFNRIWSCHESSLLARLLESAGLDFSWGATITPIAYSVASTVKPDVKNEGDDMDIRQYIQFKKVPGGSRSECALINGAVCTKNVSHRGMKSRINNPQILVIASHIDFYRSEGVAGKSFSNQNLLDLEGVYIKKVVNNIALLRPDIVITGEGVSHLAKESLLAEGITLIINVKLPVLQRISRCTQSQIIPSVDSPLLDPKNHDLYRHQILGMCHSFYLHSFPVSCSSSSRTKILMFFDGCASHLGCTVLLRGASNSELRTVKRVMYFFIYAIFNWQLERSFFMDEFASPISEKAKKIDASRLALSDSESNKNIDGCEKNIDNETGAEQVLKNIPDSSFSCSVDDSSESHGKKKVRDLNSPLVASEEIDTALNEKDNLSYRQSSFRTGLGRTVLSVSPFIKYDVPYLLSREGNHCPLRTFFPKQLYFSRLLESPVIIPKTVDCSVRKLKSPTAVTRCPIAVRHKQEHSFIHRKITTGVNDLRLKAALADFRARGCTIQRVCPCEQEDSHVSENDNPESFRADRENEGSDNFCSKDGGYNGAFVTSDGKVDALHPFNHQRISILFFSFSNSFQFTSVFCSNPRVLTKDFYGRNDITLGDFLESYCFNASYQCPSAACQSPSQRHVRKFVHETGCVEVLIRKMESPLDQVNASAIYMWTWCNICREVSPVVPMSGDTWLFSFAKYLQLRFRDADVSRRGAHSCGHSIHQDHYHYFGQKDMVAVLKYNAISLRELVIPPPMIEFVAEKRPSVCLIGEMKSSMGQGIHILGTIAVHLATIAEAAEKPLHPSVVNATLRYQYLCQVLREDVQRIKDNWNFDPDDQEIEVDDVGRAAVEGDSMSERTHAVEDQLVRLKRSFVQIVSEWNLKVQDLLNLKKKEDKEKSSSGSLSNVASSVQLVTAEEEERARNCDPANKEKLDVNVEASSSSSCSSGSEQLSTQLFASETIVEDAKKIASSVKHLDLLTLPNAFVWHVGMATTLKSLFERIQSSWASSDHSSAAAVAADDEKGCAALSENDPPPPPSPPSPPPPPAPSLDRTPEKRSVKNLISSLLSSSADFMIKTPFPPNEHHTVLLPETRVPLVLYDDEPSSIIAKALASQQFQTHRRRCLLRETKKVKASALDRGPQNEASKDAKEKVKTRGDKRSNIAKSEFSDKEQKEEDAEEDAEEGEGGEGSLRRHVDLQWSDQHANFYCKVLFVESFEAMRSLMFPHGEETFLRSLSRCVLWEARGGKSGSFFCKTTDDRFILKGMSRFEVASFSNFAPAYVDYMIKCKADNRPTVLTRIVGVYRIGFKNLTTNKALKLHLLVMENLFYRRNIGHKFDLKGSVSNRKVNLNGKEDSEEVLMDENLLQMVSSSPFYLRPHCKAVLTRAIAADTTFLSQHLIMDYSLLVGVDESRNQLVVGIIDYIRTFTWDKMLETVFKRSVLGVGTGKLPTVISPELYRNRFCHAMENYFVLAPDRWTGLGDYSTSTAKQ